MSTLREAAQQALEALEILDAPPSGVVDHYELNRRKQALRDALAQPDTCEWTQDGDEESSTWQAACSGRYFVLEDGTPKDINMAHCCYCGKKLVEVPFEQEEGDG